jgi:hypothetical protein
LEVVDAVDQSDVATIDLQDVWALMVTTGRRRTGDHDAVGNPAQV